MMPLAADVNANLLRSLKVVQSIGEAVPHGGILKAVAGIGITILETADRVRQNKEECADIARRAAEHISMLKRLDEDEGLSDDLIGRLERYHGVLKEILEKVERLGTGPSWKRTLRSSSVQDETKDCLNRLNEAYQMYIFEASVATDNKLTTLVRSVNALSLRLQVSPRGGEADEIPIDRLEFGQEIQLVDKKTYVLRLEHGQMTDIMGRPRRVILRRFEAKPDVEDDDRRLEEFKREVELRHDLLNQYVARVLGIASSKTGRTKMIVMEAGTISAYDYLQNLSGLEYFLEQTRVMCEFVSGYRFLREHRGSWRGGYQDVLLSAKDKRLCMGGLGRMDGRWEDSGWRMNEAFLRLKDGDNWTGAGSWSFEEYANEFERMRESVTKWSEERTEANGRDLFNWLKWWSGSSEEERGTENSPTVGKIGWKDGNVWHPIPLLHPFRLAQPLQYLITAARLREGEWETVVGMRIGEYTRWSIEVSPGEEIYLHTNVRPHCTNDIANFFYGSALSLAKDFGVDVRSLRLVSQKGFRIDTSLTISDEQPSIVYYFAHPPNPDGSMPDPPGFWSSSPSPYRSDLHLQVDPANVRFYIGSSLHFERISSHAHPLLQDLDSLGFLPIPSITYAAGPAFASITKVTGQQASEVTFLKRAKNLLRRMSRSASANK